MIDPRRHVSVMDPVLGFIGLSDAELSVVDDPNLQRLRYVRQMGFTYLVFPGANHTRFEHSIGTMKITRDICKTLGIEFEEAPMAGLLHDIGHTPFSHAGESIVKEYLKKDHEQIGKEIISKGSIRDRISESTLSFKKLMSYLGNTSEARVISGPLGSDRMDYLIRDSYYTGAVYGTIEYETVKNKMVLVGHEPAILESGIESAESMLIARYHMHSSIYNHHTILIASVMLEKALRFSIEEGEIDPREIPTLSDSSLFDRLCSSKTASSELTKRIMERRLFKRVMFEDADPGMDTNDIRSCLLDAGIEDSKFIVSNVRLRGAADDMPVSDRHGKILGKLSERSKIFNVLANTLGSWNMILVASDKMSTESVSSALKKAHKI